MKRKVEEDRELITVKDVEKNTKIKTFVLYCQKQLDELGYTEHSTRHAKFVSVNTGNVLRELGYEERIAQLGEIAGYVHDIGNSINRVDHAHTGAILAYNALTEMGLDVEEATQIMMAVGNHDELTGTPVSSITAALILADKSDVHRSRVRNRNKMTFEIHDRVNYAVNKSKLSISKDKTKVILELTIDTAITQIMDYFEIFTDRMTMSKKAAKYLGLRFELIINGSKVLG